MKMNRNLSVAHAINFSRFLSLKNSTMKEEKSKLYKECINGVSKLPNISLSVNFKNQKAFHRYRKDRIDLYKSFFLIYLI